MKLELKHISPYLPYGLKFDGKRNGWVSFDGNIKTLCPVDLDGRWDVIKPILRPLSDLNTYYVSQNILDRIKECSSKDIKEALNYNSISYLLENHFDIFNLIEQGLAISIHDVNQTTTS